MRRRSATIWVLVVVCAGVVFAVAMLVARERSSPSAGPAATPTRPRATTVSARQTPDRTPRPAPTPTARPGARSASDDDLYSVIWVGDILVGDLAQKQIDRRGYAWPFEHVRSLLGADFVIGNHEGPITERTTTYFPDARWDYDARPASAKALADVGFNAVGLSNNHILDRGPEGLVDTLNNLQAAGIRTFGAGRDGAEAAAPLLIHTPHGVIGVLAFGEAWRQGAVAGPGRAGTVPFSDERIADGAQAARAAGARWIVGFVHWGVNYGSIVPRQRQLAASFARAGYTLVVGHHPHVVQAVDVVQGMPVLYSIGNFVFGTDGRFTAEAPGYGLVVRTSFGPEGLRTIQLRCILTNNDVVNFRPRLCDEASAQTLIRSLGPHVSWSNGAGLLAP
jgi:poly-gamma-glutamate capsule biosynthesis protein CapA/YwtB (metallophosphatase superfamily)